MKEDSYFVINVGRQIGSGGKTIADELARRLAVTAYDKKLIDLAAQESGIDKKFFEKADEKASKNYFRMFFGFRETGLNEYSFNTNCLSGNELFKIQSDVIRRLVQKSSCIFVGRCADYILRDHPRMFNLFVTGDLGDRIARVTSRFGVNEKQACEIIERGDRMRAEYYNYYSNRKWGDAGTYHLCINSSALGIEGTTDLLYKVAVEKLHIEP